MKHTRLTVAILFMSLFLCAIPQNVDAKNNPNTITFDNKSGEPALVKLIGPTRQTVEVANSKSRKVNVASGRYYILIRYGSKPEKYRYAKGDPFTVTQTATQYSAITITLHKVIGGDYATHPTSQEEFERVMTGGKGSDNKSAQAQEVEKPKNIAKGNKVIITGKVGGYAVVLSGSVELRIIEDGKSGIMFGEGGVLLTPISFADSEGRFMLELTLDKFKGTETFVIAYKWHMSADFSAPEVEHLTNRDGKIRLFKFSGPQKIDLGKIVLDCPSGKLTAENCHLFLGAK